MFKYSEFLKHSIKSFSITSQTDTGVGEGSSKVRFWHEGLALISLLPAPEDFSASGDFSRSRQQCKIVNPLPNNGPPGHLFGTQLRPLQGWPTIGTWLLFMEKGMGWLGDICLTKKMKAPVFSSGFVCWVFFFHGEGKGHLSITR